jgi:zona occludens toxin (predicted ATPase)
MYVWVNPKIHFLFIMMWYLFIHTIFSELWPPGGFFFFFSNSRASQKTQRPQRQAATFPLWLIKSQEVNILYLRDQWSDRIAA